MRAQKKGKKRKRKRSDNKDKERLVNGRLRLPPNTSVRISMGNRELVEVDPLEEADVVEPHPKLRQPIFRDQKQL